MTIRICKKCFKAGFYERFYSYFDTQTIIRSIKTFLEERALTIA